MGFTFWMYFKVLAAVGNTVHCIIYASPALFQELSSTSYGSTAAAAASTGNEKDYLHYSNHNHAVDNDGAGYLWSSPSSPKWAVVHSLTFPEPVSVLFASNDVHSNSNSLFLFLFWVVSVWKANTTVLGTTYLPIYLMN